MAVGLGLCWLFVMQLQVDLQSEYLNMTDLDSETDCPSVFVKALHLWFGFAKAPDYETWID